MVTLGAALTELGQAEDAIPHLEQALALQPKYARAHLRFRDWHFTTLGGRRVPSISSTRQIAFDPTTSKCCGTRPGFWRQVPGSSIRDGAQAIDLATGRSSFPAVRSRLCLRRAWPRHLPKPRFTAAVAPPRKRQPWPLRAQRRGLVGAIEQRKRLYRQGLPYRERRPRFRLSPGAADGSQLIDVAGNCPGLTSLSSRGRPSRPWRPCVGPGRRLLSGFPLAGISDGAGTPAGGDHRRRLPGHATSLSTTRLSGPGQAMPPAPSGLFGAFTSAAAGALPSV